MPRSLLARHSAGTMASGAMDGNQVGVTTELASVFELEGGRIRAGRDYCSPEGLRAALAARDFKPEF